ncbi:MAG: citrate lyase subunit beta / citryl-CoA lyase [Pseudonocardiales bacterium]|nr:citrate lyase subunit beta / citryl-CoA lyase [Pseudonocardiales bacterium]
MYTRYCRSMLCTPAIAEDRYAHCYQSGADICLVDLEDSVPLARKEEARFKARDFFAGACPPTRCAVRINTVTEPAGLRDLLALRDFPVKANIVLVPKVESARDLEIVEAVLGDGCPELELLAVMETPRGLERLAEITSTSAPLRAVIFGSADYAAALGIGLAWEPLVYARSLLVNAARAAKIEVIDSPLFDLTDLSLLRREAECALALGYSGKIALHPRQVEVINEVFSPGAAELEHAHQVVTAAERSGQGITTVGGSMVGRPFFDASRRLLEEFEPLVPADSTAGSPDNT